MVLNWLMPATANHSKGNHGVGTAETTRSMTPTVDVDAMCRLKCSWRTGTVYSFT